jgi:hypothetical protein
MLMPWNGLPQGWNAVLCPLSINYRCSKAVVRNAQKVVPEIEA